LAIAAEAAESLAAEFVECLKRTPAIGAAVALVSCDFRPRNCGAAANTLRATGQVRDDPRLSRLSNTFYLQRDRSTTNAERAADCKMARL
jgi:hypothetical protein